MLRAVLIGLAVTLVIVLAVCGCSDNSTGPKIDDTAPCAVSNLTVSGYTNLSVTLTWNAPGDDNATGTAASYDIRFSNEVITELNWDSATQVNGEPTPQRAGYPQQMTITNLDDDSTYYFAMMTSDECENVSPLSNCAETNWPDDYVVTIPDYHLESVIRGNIGNAYDDIYRSELLALQYLVADYLDIFELTGLEYCTELTYLLLNGNYFTDITALATLTKLEVLLLAYMDITSIAPLSEMTNLADLNLRGNRVSDLGPLAGLHSLVNIDLAGNEISDIGPLSGLTNLRGAYLDINPITDIAPLSGLTGLGWIALRNCEIQEISAVAGMTSLYLLYVDNNHISDLTPLSNHPSLQCLAATSNTIEDISALATIATLDYLILDDNNISDIKPLVDNTNFGSGCSVRLTGNPLSSESIEIYIPALEARGVSVTF